MEGSKTSDSYARRTVPLGQTLEKFSGRYQPAMSRADTKVWLLTKRPGPGAYRTSSAIGKQVDARKVTAPAVRFSMSKRAGPTKTPSQGPKYKLNSSLGRQQSSKRRTAPSHGFGTSTRDHALKQYGVWSV